MMESPQGEFTSVAILHNGYLTPIADKERITECKRSASSEDNPCTVV